MFGNDITIPHLLIFFPLVAGLAAFFIKSEKGAKGWSLLASILTLGISILSLVYAKRNDLNGYTFNYEWLKYMGASFSVQIDGVGRLLTLLTAVSFPVIFNLPGLIAAVTTQEPEGIGDVAKIGLGTVVAPGGA